MTDPQRAEVNKRLTLNLLIQGVASHTFLTSHHLVRDELRQVDGDLVDTYDRLAVSLYLNYWIGDLIPILGRTSKFWRGVRKPSHPFHHHPLLATHGAELSSAARRHAASRAEEKQVSAAPGRHYLQMYKMLSKTMRREGASRRRLAEVAKLAVQRLWSVPSDRLDADLTLDMSEFWGPEPDNLTTRIMQNAVAGYSSVVRSGDRLVVEAKAVTWVLLSHELTKGVAELVCLRGVAGLSESDYEGVIARADRIDQEAWLMQAGSELWRRLLALAPPGRPLAEVLMRIAILPADKLERVMMAVCEPDPRAGELLAEAIEG